jgi:LacI family transcriptional regulator
MTQQLLSLGRAFDAVVTFSDEVAAAAIAQLCRRGVTVPDQVAVAGFDGAFAPHAMVIPLTTVQQPREIGKPVFDQLLRRMQASDDQPPPRIMLAPRLIVRESTVKGAGIGE